MAARVAPGILVEVWFTHACMRLTLSQARSLPLFWYISASLSAPAHSLKWHEEQWVRGSSKVRLRYRIKRVITTGTLLTSCRLSATLTHYSGLKSNKHVDRNTPLKYFFNRARRMKKKMLVCTNCSSWIRGGTSEPSGPPEAEDCDSPVSLDHHQGPWCPRALAELCQPHQPHTIQSPKDPQGPAPEDLSHYLDKFSPGAELLEW